MQLTKKQIKKYRKHPEIFVEQILGIKLYRYQKLMLKHLPKKYLSGKGENNATRKSNIF